MAHLGRLYHPKCRVEEGKRGILWVMMKKIIRNGNKLSWFWKTRNHEYTRHSPTSGAKKYMMAKSRPSSSSSITKNINIIILRTTPTTWWRQPWQLSARNCGTSNYTTTLCTHARAAAINSPWMSQVSGLLTTTTTNDRPILRSGPRRSGSRK